MGDHNRELAATRLRDSERLRHELDAAQRRARSAEEDSNQKQAIISHNNKQVGPEPHISDHLGPPASSDRRGQFPPQILALLCTDRMLRIGLLNFASLH